MRLLAVPQLQSPLRDSTNPKSNWTRQGFRKHQPKYPQRKSQVSPGFPHTHLAARSSRRSSVSSFSTEVRQQLTLTLDVNSVIDQQKRPCSPAHRWHIRHFQRASRAINFVRPPRPHPQPPAPFAILKFQSHNLQTTDFHKCLQTL